MEDPRSWLNERGLKSNMAVTSAISLCLSGEGISFYHAGGFRSECPKNRLHSRGFWHAEAAWLLVR